MELIRRTQHWPNPLGEQVARFPGRSHILPISRFHVIALASYYIVDTGIQLFKFWLEVGDEEQKRRFEARIEDPLRQWKLSGMDLPSRSKWYAYSRARDQMLEATDTEHAPWHIVHSDDKRRARLNLIAHFLSLIPYEEIPRGKVELPKRSKKDAYDDIASIADRRFVPERY